MAVYVVLPKPISNENPSKNVFQTSGERSVLIAVVRMRMKAKLLRHNVIVVAVVYERLNKYS